jgi:hypothetical protein
MKEANSLRFEFDSAFATCPILINISNPRLEGSDPITSKYFGEYKSSISLLVSVNLTVIFENEFVSIVALGRTDNRSAKQTPQEMKTVRKVNIKALKNLFFMELSSSFYPGTSIRILSF